MARWWSRRPDDGPAPEEDLGDDLPSLNYLEEHVRRLLDEQRERATGIDSRSGVLLGFAGLVMTSAVRSGGQASLFQVAAGLLAGAAAITAALALVPRVASSLDPVALLENYAAEDEHETRFRIASTLAGIHAQNDKPLALKAKRTIVAATLLVAAVLVLLVGAIVDTELLQEAWTWMQSPADSPSDQPSVEPPSGP